MEIRKDIISLLNEPVESYELEKLIYSIELTPKANIWFKGIIDSLYYKPNHQVLILEGVNPNISIFFEDLFPDIKWYSTKEKLYECLLYNAQFEKKDLKKSELDNFIIVEPNETEIYPHTDKRLCSYCSVVNKWHFDPRSNFIVHHVDYFDIDLFNSIDKLKLWREIFKIFKPCYR